MQRLSLIHIYVKAPLNIPSIVDKNKGTIVKGFEKDGVKVTFPEITSGAKQTEALAAGSLDIASCLGGTSAILAASNGCLLYTSWRSWPDT